MVQIAAPLAASVAANAATVDVSSGTNPPPNAEPLVAQASPPSPPAAAQVAGMISRHAMWLSAAGAAVVVTAGIVGSALYRSDPDAAAAPEVALATTDAKAPATANDFGRDGESTKPVDAQMIDEPARMPDQPQPTAPESAKADIPDLPPLPRVGSPAVGEVDHTGETPVSAVGPQKPNDDVGERAPRTLTLEPVEVEPPSDHRADTSVAEYPSLVDEGNDHAEAKSTANLPSETEQSSEDTTPNVNVPMQLDVSIATIEFPSVTLRRFVDVVSEMSDVSIEIDPSIAAASEQMVRVQASDVTLGQLLTRTLAAQGLQWQARNGRIVIEPANSAP
jgi:hypothetical protein